LIEVALERMKADKTLPLSTQLNILEAHGFQNINGDLLFGQPPIRVFSVERSPLSFEALIIKFTG